MRLEATAARSLALNRGAPVARSHLSVATRLSPVQLNDKYADVVEEVRNALEQMEALEGVVFNLLARSRLKDSDMPTVNLEEAVVRVAEHVRAYNARCTVHVFLPGSGKADGATSIELAPIVAPAISGILNQIKQQMGHRIHRVSLPREYQEIVRGSSYQPDPPHAHLMQCTSRMPACTTCAHHTRPSPVPAQPITPAHPTPSPPAPNPPRPLRPPTGQRAADNDGGDAQRRD